MGDTANFSEYIKYLSDLSEKNRFKYDKSMGDYKTWAEDVRKVLASHLALKDDGTPLNSKILDVKECGGYRRETVEISVNGYLRLRGVAFVPNDSQKKHPAVLCLSGHGWQYYFDLAKSIDYNGQENDPSMRDTRANIFGGKCIPEELAMRGYIAMIFETFYFGNYNLDVEHVPDLFKEEFHVDPSKYQKGSQEYIEAYNLFCRRFEAYMTKYLAFAGVTWPGLLLEEDKKGIDYLASRDDVDKDRIGCQGLSLGGFRSILLAGMDERIKCAAVSGWMCRLGDMVEEHAKFHTFMMFQGSLWNQIDVPDLAALSAPNALIVQNGIHDVQFGGVPQAYEQIQKFYEDVGCPEKCLCKLYDAPHCFNAEMQKDAYQFMEKHLKS